MNQENDKHGVVKLIVKDLPRNIAFNPLKNNQLIYYKRGKKLSFHLDRAVNPTYYFSLWKCDIVAENYRIMSK